jgi:hypothetical protein
MVTVKTVSVQYERKIQTAPYESATIGCQLWADLDSEEQGEIADVMKRLWRMVKMNVKAASAYERKKPEEANQELGLPGPSSQASGESA